MFKKLLCAFMIMLLISTGGVLNVDASEIPQCSMTIEQGKHTESSPAKASGICGEKDDVWGYYVPNLDTFVVRGMVNRDVRQSGQVFDVPIPSTSYRPQLTVYIVRKAVEPAPPKEEPKPSNPTPPKEEKPAPNPSNPTPPKEEKPAPNPSNPTPTPPKEEKTETKPSTQKVETQSKNNTTSVTNKQTETKNSSVNEKNVSGNSTKEEKDDSSVTNKEEKQSSKNSDTKGEDENNVDETSEDIEADTNDDEAVIDNNLSSELEEVESEEKNDVTKSKQSKSFLAELPNSVKWIALPSVLTISIAGGIYWWFRKKGMI